ncbi:MAG: PBP1A family penicillin-binding protein [Patescibacteria group bacterium]
MLTYIKKLFYRVEDFIIKALVFIFKKRKTKVFKNTLITLVSLVLLGCGIFLIWFTTVATPSLDAFDDKLLGQSAKIYDRTGTILLYDLSQKVRRSVVPLENISPWIIKATVSIEDKEFYSHRGIKITSLIRATFANISEGEYSQGGSTITQQVIKNSFLTTDKKIIRKIKEIFLAIKLERSMSKDDIMTLYLNNSPYGGNIYGVEEASQVFFGKHAKDVSIAEAAILASLPKAPSTYNPYFGKKDLLLARKNLVLEEMYSGGFITEEEKNTAQGETVVFQPKNLGSIKAPHFVMYLKQQLEEQFGAKKLAEGGFTVVSTIDYEMQKMGENLVSEYVAKNGKRFNAENASMVVIDPKTGQILAMIGSRDYFDTEIDGNYNIATAKRQPGSSFKPFVYATGFNKGFLPQTVLFDTATEFNSSCTPSGTPKVAGATCYNPQNYEGGFKGPMTIRKALGESRNIPAVKMTYLAGLQNVINTAKAMGITDLDDASKYGLSLGLGSADVSLLDMTSAYGVFANDGVRNKITGVLKIQGTKGEVIEEFSTSSKRVLPEQSARMINDILADPIARNTIFVRSYFKNDVVAVKTGTTNNSRDAWTVGYTPTISVGAWMGNNNNKPMSQIASALIVSPLWKSYMDELLKMVPKEGFIKPDEVSSDTKPFMRGVYQTVDGSTHSELYFVNIKDPAGDMPTNPAADPQYYNWEASIYSGAPVSTSTNPTTTTPGSGAGLSLYIQGKQFNLSKSESIQVAVQGYSTNTLKVEYFVNDARIGESTSAPYGYSIAVSEVMNLEPENEVRVIEYHTDGSAPRSSSITFTVQE